MGELAGTLSAGREPIAGAVVLAAELGGAVALASTRTDDDGRFSLAVPDGILRVFARAGAGEAVGVATRTVEAPAEGALALDLEHHAPLHPVSVVAEGDVPPELDLQLTPERIHGVEREALALLHATVPGVTHPMLVTRPFGPARRVDLRMQAGGWILYSAYDLAPDARGAGSRHLAWRVERAAIEGGAELPPAVIGHALEVDGPLTVILRIVRLER
jgi:hypothetical protein